MVIQWLHLLTLTAVLQGFLQRDTYSDLQIKTRQVIKECLKYRKIINMRTWNCHLPNSQGGCDKGERLVVNKQSRSTTCINNKDADGRSCLDGEIAYNGTCEIINSKNACEGEGRGKRLNADLYGTVSCRCSADLGYVEVDGICYHEYFRGPCPRNSSLRGSKCVPKNCRKGKIGFKIKSRTNYINH